VVRLIASFRAGRNATAYGKTRRFVGGFFFVCVKLLIWPLVTSVFHAPAVRHVCLTKCLYKHVK